MFSKIVRTRDFEENFGHRRMRLLWLEERPCQGGDVKKFKLSFFVEKVDVKTATLDK